MSDVNIGQIIFVVWRESVEALLIIGILWAWLNNNPAYSNGKKYLYGGIVFGLVVAILLACLLLGITQFLDDEGQYILTACMLALASCLIVQMVMWMSSHSKHLKSQLEGEIQLYAEKSSWWGVFFVTAIAIAREGSETVIFLSGNILALDSAKSIMLFSAYALLGFIIAFFTFYLLRLSEKFLSWKVFFKITEFILLFLACALFLQSVEILIGEILVEWDWPDWVYTTVWDTSAILDDDKTVGGLFSTFFAYRARPTAYNVISFVAYWTVVLALFKLQNSKK